MDRVEVRPERPEIYVGQRLQLDALPTDRSGEDLGARPTVWASSDESIATVTSSGVVEGIQLGEARISATIEGVEGSVTVVVGPTPLDVVVVEPNSLELVAGERGTLKAKALDVLGEELEEVSFSWSSSDEAVAQVDVRGQVIARSPGEATIGASVEGVQGSARLRVVATRIERLIAVEERVSIPAGQRRRLEVHAVDVDNVPQPGVDLSWRSADMRVASVSADGLLQALRAGQTEIIISARGLEAKIAVTVRELPVNRLELEPDTLIWIESGEAVPILARAFDAEDEEVLDPPLRWTTSNPTVATVDATGLVQAHRGGETEIRISVDEASASVEVQVHEGVGEVRIVGDFVDMIPGEGRRLTAEVFDRRGKPTSLFPAEWSSSDETVAMVRHNTIEAVRTGVVTITAISRGVEASVEIAVIDLQLAKIRSGGNMTCGLTTAGSLFCWGRVEHVSFSFPSRLGSGPYRDLEVSGVHLCVLDFDGRAFCVGENGYGQLGDGSLLDAPLKLVPVAGGYLFESIALGGALSCAVAMNLEPYCWGLASLPPFSSPPIVAFDSPVPAMVPGPIGFSRLVAADHGQSGSSGAAVICGLAADDGAWCLGANSTGELGDGTLIKSAEPVAVAGGHTFSSLSVTAQFDQGSFASYGHGCGLKQDRSVHCWGANRFGELGIGRESAYELGPQEVLGGHQFKEIHVQSVATTSPTGSVSCGLSKDGVVLCWGKNEWVLPSAGVHSIPTPISNPAGLRFQSLSLGIRHACAIASNGKTYCWGANENGRLGVGSEDLKVEAPTLVLGQTPDPLPFSPVPAP